MPFESLFKDFSRSENASIRPLEYLVLNNCVGDSWMIFTLLLMNKNGELC